MFFSSSRRRPLLWNPEGFLRNTFSLLPGIITVKVLYVSWVWLWDCSLTHSQSGLITVNFSAFAHWKKRCSWFDQANASTAGLTTLRDQRFFFSQCFIENVISDHRYQTIHYACAKHGNTAEMYCGKWYNNNGKYKLDVLFRFGSEKVFIFCFGLKIGK